jgi:hypothetical protein
LFSFRTDAFVEVAGVLFHHFLQRRGRQNVGVLVEHRLQHLDLLGRRFLVFLVVVVVVVGVTHSNSVMRVCH